MARLVLAQPYELICDALEQLLDAAGFAVVACCDRVADLARCVRTHRPDITLADADMAPGGDVAALVRMVSEDLGGGRLVLLACSVSPALARDTLALAVDGVVLKHARSADVVAALRRIVAGDAVYPAGWIAAARRTDGSLLEQLSPRQVEVLELMAMGLPNELIAERLFISRNTVKFHVAAVYQRLGVCNRVQAAHALESLRAAGHKSPPRRGGPQPFPAGGHRPHRGRAATAAGRFGAESHASASSQPGADQAAPTMLTEGAFMSEFRRGTPRGARTRLSCALVLGAVATVGAATPATAAGRAGHPRPDDDQHPVHGVGRYAGADGQVLARARGIAPQRAVGHSGVVERLSGPAAAGDRPQPRLRAQHQA